MVRLNTKTNYKNEHARVRQGEKSQNYRNDIMIKVILKAHRNVNKYKIKNNIHFMYGLPTVRSIKLFLNIYFYFSISKTGENIHGDY